MPAPIPVVFFDGIWIRSLSWEKWLGRVDERGYAPVAPGWPGESAMVASTRVPIKDLAGAGVQDITHHYAGIIQELPQPPIVIGHSFGGLVAQKLPADGLASAAIAIVPAAIKGSTKLPFNQIRSALPVLAKKSNKEGVAVTEYKKSSGRGQSLTIDSAWSESADYAPLAAEALAGPVGDSL